MLNLKSTTAPPWLDMVVAHTDEVLIDHAHCERKAASTAMNLINAYSDRVPLVRAMTEIVVEELEHFQIMLELLAERRVPFRRLKASNYGSQLHALVRQREPGRGVDRLLVAGLIEARSCERFAVLRDGLADRRLADFYGGLFESEARHHATYVRLAKLFDADEAVVARLDALADAEAEIIARGDVLPRVHS